MLTKNIGTLLENVDEKCWQHFLKMLMENIGNTYEKC
jgi:hypothetical protein